MKKYSINYFSWITWFLVHSLTMAVFAFGVYKGLTYEKKYSMDFIGNTLAIVMSVGLGIICWETVVLFDFLIKDAKGEIFFSNAELKILNKGQYEVLNFKDLKSVEFVSPRVGTKSILGHASHCKLTFGERSVILTSFTIHNIDVIKHLGNRISKSSSRERRYFELIK